MRISLCNPLSSLVPNAADLLSIEVEELAGVLLAHLNGDERDVSVLAYEGLGWAIQTVAV